jgi:hypothetical protein
MSIRAATVEEIVWDDESWIVLDIGFAGSKNKSSGLGIGVAPAVNVTFSEACQKIIDRIDAKSATVNLVVEAPLSVAFDVNGNPTVRAFEKRDGETRGWYLGPAPSVTVAALRLLKRIQDSISPAADLRLVEGFATFKDKRTDHAADVEALREVIRGRQGRIISPMNFAQNTSDNVESLAAVGGIETGIPPVVMPW